MVNNKKISEDIEKSPEIFEEGDKITELEEGFIEGYESAKDPSKCALCGKILRDENFIEEEIKGEYYRFCSPEHAEEFKKQQKK